MKTKSRLESTNFLTNVVTLIFIVLGVQGIQWDIDPGQAIEEIMANNWEYIGTILFPALSGLVFKVVQKIQTKTWDWKAVIRSTNFWTQAITVLSGALAFAGILLPPDAPTEITAAIFSGSVWTLIVAIVANIATPLWHFFKDIFKKKEQPATI